MMNHEKVLIIPVSSPSLIIILFLNSYYFYSFLKIYTLKILQTPCAVNIERFQMTGRDADVDLTRLPHTPS